MKQYADFDTTIAGIPCGIKVTHFRAVAGDSSTWASDWDYYGYTELDYIVLDRKGYPAPWLEKKLDKQDQDRIYEECIEACSSRYDDGDDFEGFDDY